jgi:hypothetical protein
MPLLTELTADGLTVGYKDFAPTELRSESFVARGRAPFLHAVFEAPIGGASHSVCGGIRRVRLEIWNRVGRVPQPRRPETGVTRWGCMWRNLSHAQREPRLTGDLDGRSGVRNNSRGNRERNAAPLRVLMHFYCLLAVFGILHGPTQFGDLLPERIT